MVDRLEALAELDRRGKLPEDLRPAFEEAKRRGLVPGTEGQAAQPRQSGGQEQATDANPVMDSLNQFGERFNQGLYATINAPTHLANMATSAVGAGAPFKPPLEAIAPAVHDWFADAPEAETDAGRVVGTIGEYAGANALPGMGVIAAAPRVARGAGMLAPMARQIASSPGRAAAGEAGATVGAGLGAQIARDVAPDNPGAEMIGATIGGIAAPATALAPSNLARKGAQSVARRFSPEATQRRQRQQVTDEFRRNLTPTGEARIRESAEIQKDIPGYQPSVAEATESPSFIATQRDFERGLSGSDLDRATDRYSANDLAIQRAVRNQAPQSPIDLDAAFDQARNRRAGVEQRIERQEGVLDQHQRGVTQQNEPNWRRRDLGEGLREAIISERGNAQNRLSEQARQTGLNNEAARYDFGSIRERLIQSVEPRSQLADRSALPNNIIADIRAMDDNSSIVDMMTLRSRVGADIREAQRMPTGEKRVPYLQSLKSEIDVVTDELIDSVGDEQLKEGLRNFRRDWREAIVIPFEQGAAGRVLQKDISGAYKIPDEAVAKEFFGNWKQTAADQFQQIFKNEPLARSAMEAAALDDLYDHAVRDGVFDPSLVANWTRRHRGVLSSFPGIDAKVSNIESTLGSIAQRRAQLSRRRDIVQRTYLSRELARLDNPVSNVTPESVVDQAIANPSRMGRLLQGLRSNEAKRAVSRQVWDRALSSGSPVEFLTQNKDAIGPALQGKFPTAMRLARAIEKNQLVPRPSGQAIDTNPVGGLENVLGTGLNQISSRVFAVQSGRTSSRYALADIAGRAVRSMTARQANDLMRDALYDPQIATDLANALESGDMTVESAKRLYTYMLSNGLIAAENVDEQRAEPLPQ